MKENFPQLSIEESAENLPQIWIGTRSFITALRSSETSIKNSLGVEFKPSH